MKEREREKREKLSSNTAFQSPQSAVLSKTWWHFLSLEFCPWKPPNPTSSWQCSVYWNPFCGLCTTKPILNECLLCDRHYAKCLLASTHVILRKLYKGISTLSLLPFARWSSERWGNSPKFTWWQSLNVNLCGRTPKSALLLNVMIPFFCHYSCFAEGTAVLILYLSVVLTLWPL